MKDSEIQKYLDNFFNEDFKRVYQLSLITGYDIICKIDEDGNIEFRLRDD